MKIIHISQRFALAGGVETYIANLLPLLESSGCENVVIYRQAHERMMPSNGRAILHVPRLADEQQDAQQMAEIVHNLGPSVVYLHDVYDPLVIRQVAEVAPSVGYIHIFYPICPGLAKLYRRGDEVCQRPFGLGCIPQIYLRRCASARHPSSVVQIMQTTSAYLSAYRQLPRLIVASNYMRDLMVQNGILSSRVGILPPYFAAASNSPEVNSSEGTLEQAAVPTILFVGRLEYEKGVPYLLQSLQQVPNARLRIAGDGSLREEFVKLAVKLAIAERVQFLGWLSGDELTAAYRSADVVVMPTIMPEPFGIVGMEAMANGRPVVAFDVGGISDWLTDGFNGFLVPPCDVNQLANQINKILRDRKLAMQLGNNGRQYVRVNYSPEIHVQQLMKIFESITQN